MNSSTVIIAFTVFFVIWLVNTKRLARIVELYQGDNASGNSEPLNPMRPEGIVPTNPANPGPVPPISGPVDSGAGARARAKKKRNPMYLPPVKL
jgi:hypothetical protein